MANTALGEAEDKRAQGYGFNFTKFITGFLPPMESCDCSEPHVQRLARLGPQCPGVLVCVSDG